MFLRGIRVPLFAKAERNLVNQVGKILMNNNLFFSNILVITTERLHHLFKKNLEYSDISESIFFCYITSNSMDEVERAREIIQRKDPPLIIGFGGGKVIDVAKYAAFKERRNFLSLPTTLSHDGISSPVAVIRVGGYNQSLGAKIPIGVICDTEIIKNAPIRTLRAGVGDLISNLSADKDWKLAIERRKDVYDDIAALIAVGSAQLIYNSKINLNDYHFLEELAKALVLSGISMEIAGTSRPCSGAEHKFSHALDQIVPHKTSLHGEQVALGTILASYLREEEFDEFVAFFKEVGLPVNCREIGIAKDKIVEALVYAPKTRPGRYTILEEIKINKKIAEKACKETKVI